MKRVILDTNIYGRIVEIRQEEEITEIIGKKKYILIYGYDIVRKELRDVPSKRTIENKRLRLALLALYDRLVKSHIYFTTEPIRQLASDYHKAYKQLGGKESEKEMLNDFLIVACASIHELDIVVSDDTNTMLSKEALKSYKIVNTLRKYKLPDFIGFEKFRRSFF
ncbi:MAG: hypothetical protein HYT73_02050 [Candidatus Aenigmarchaeota archaeon]|nr:hypothetical protein [Candidatus Aenigmarchaeota archaeon]